MNEQFLTSGAGRADNAASDATTMEPAPTAFGRAAGHRTPIRPSVLAGAMLLLLTAAPLRADSFTVDSIADGAASCKTPKNCTLRAALLASEADAGSSTIYLPKGEYRLARALPPIRTTVIIRGAGPESTVIMGPCTVTERLKDTGWCPVSGADFTVLENAGTLSLIDLTVQGGTTYENEAGGILNRGSLSLDHVWVMGNMAHGGAGGIMNFDKAYLYLSNSMVRENSSSYGLGGGIVNRSGGRADIVNTTISGNRVFGGHTVNSGGIMNQGLLAMSASTISGNQGITAGAILNLGETWANGVTITANTGFPGPGGVMNVNASDRFFFGNSIIAGNNPNDCEGGDLSTLRGNLVGKTLCNIKDWSGLAGLGGKPPADRVGKYDGISLYLSTFPTPNWVPELGNNGGPTCTHALCMGGDCLKGVSLARNAGWQNTTTAGFACSATDQRGVPRNSCDSGAFEWVMSNPKPRPELGTCRPTILLK